MSSAKAKGRNLQKLVAEEISILTGVKWGKDLDIESRPMGQSGTDVVLRGKAKELFPFSVECKAQESWNMHNWVKQAKENTLEGTDWLLFCKRSRENPIVIMDISTFFGIMDEIIDKNYD